MWLNTNDQCDAGAFWYAFWVRDDRVRMRLQIEEHVLEVFYELAREDGRSVYV